MAAFSYLLLTINLLAFTALLLGYVSFARESRYERLFPLLLLVITRTLALIISLTQIKQSQDIINVLEILSTLCLVWALMGTTAYLSIRQREMMAIAGVIAVFFALLPLLPGWPVPWQIHNLVVIMAGVSLIYWVQDTLKWIHLAPPLILGVVNILTLPGLELMNLAWLLSLLAYGAFIGAIHQESVQTYLEAVQFFRDRQIEFEDMVLESADEDHERQRLLESCELINNVPSLNQSMEHLVSSMAQITHTDQAVIFVLDVKAMGRAHVASVYSPEKPFHITSRDEMAFELDELPVLRKAIETQQQNLVSVENRKGLRRIYALWNEDRIGPTLLQPLAVQGRPVGALLLGNPVSQYDIAVTDANLCRTLAPHLSIVVEYRRRYLELELQAEAMAAMVQEQLSPPVLEREPAVPWLEPAVEGVAARVTQPLPEPGPIPVEEFAPSRSPETARQPATVESPAEAPALLALSSAVSSELSAATEPPAESSFIPSQAQAENEKPFHDIEQYEAVVEAISDGVLLSDTTGRVKLVNKAAERILDRARNRLIGQPIGAVYGQIDSEESIENLAVAFSRRNQPLPTFFEDEDRAIQGRLIPWRNEDNEWMGIIGILKDVTREVRADRARNEFVAALSHELRAPLTMIKGYSELITNSRMGNYTPEQVRVQQIISSNAERMVEVLDNAIKLSMPDKNRFVVKFEEVNINKIIEDALREIKPLVEIRNLTLIREIGSNLPAIEADHRHLLRILDNLLSNGCRFAPRGGRVTVRAWARPGPAEELAGGHLYIAVADNGVGIPRREIDKIFTPFYHVKGQKVEEKPGLGIGLTVVKELVDLHNGEIRVESTEGVGTMFQIKLPVSQQY